jgi:hypothetical protein
MFGTRSITRWFWYVYNTCWQYRSVGHPTRRKMFGRELCSDGFRIRTRSLAMGRQLPTVAIDLFARLKLYRVQVSTRY